MNLEEHIHFVKLSTPIGEEFSIDVHFRLQNGELVLDDTAPHRISFSARRMPDMSGVIGK